MSSQTRVPARLTITRVREIVPEYKAGFCSSIILAELGIFAINGLLVHTGTCFLLLKSESLLSQLIYT